MYRVVAFILLLLSPACLAGNPATRPAPHVFHLHLPGVAGIIPPDHRLLQGLKEGGAPGEVEIYDWTAGHPGMEALVRYDRNQQQAAKVADLLTARFRADPSIDIHITAESGGTAIAVWALEKLPADVSVRTVVLLCSALSPNYDLTSALRHVRGNAYAFTSIYDSIVLGTGTRWMGTMDRVKTDAAGRVGFTQPPSADPVQYQKLVSVPYNADWIKLGNIGDHIGPLHRLFARTVLAPLLTGAAPTTQKGSGS